MLFHPTSKFHPEIPVDEHLIPLYEKIGPEKFFTSHSPNPHGRREMNLMKAGFKPCAIISNKWTAEWEQACISNDWSILKNTNIKNYILVSTKDEGWRITCINMIYGVIPLIGMMTKKHHEAVGRLLGMTQEDIDEFHEEMSRNGDYTTIKRTGTRFLMM